MQGLCYGQEIPVAVEPIASIEQTDLSAERSLLIRFELIDSPAIDQRIRSILTSNVTALNYSATRRDEKINPDELRLLRSAVRREIVGILATEGFFSPVVKFQNEVAKGSQDQTEIQKVIVRISIEPGLMTKVDKVQIDFVGDAVPITLQQSIQSQWKLQKGTIFRDNDWTHSKAHAIEILAEHGYAAARISGSKAIIQDQRAELFVSVESGPIFRIGELHIQGLNLYSPWLLDRYHPPAKGEVYNQARLIKFQRELQNSPYFSTVTVSIDPDPQHASAVPIDVLVQERKKYDFGLAGGYSSNTGARGEVSFQNRNFFGNAYNLKSVLRIEQLRQIGYADIFLPPEPRGHLDSVGVLLERSNIAGLLIKSGSFGAKRIFTEDSVEKRLGLSFIYEQITVKGSESTSSKALVGSMGRTWRAIDNTFDPRQGYVAQLEVSGAAKAVLSDQNFLRLYGKYQRWIPIGSRDVVILRAEGGYVFTPDDAGIPEDYLFRTGGTTSVRGYAYQSIGVSQEDGVVGGRLLTTASAEYVHWLREKWGLAGFVDTGGAADSYSALKMKQGVGIGLRYKTPAGPIAVDLAYGIQARRLRLDFFLGIAF
jgi:translocation and assembly module TamA